MKYNILWGKRALANREQIWRYLYQEAGLDIANAVDDRFVEILSLLENTPKLGVKVGNQEKKRKLVLTHFPFIIVYVIESKEIKIIRILHTARKVAARY